MAVVQIPLKAILDAILDELQLPVSTSEKVSMPDGVIAVTVMFHPSAEALRRASGQSSFVGLACTSIRAAENQAVVQALEYMERFEHKVPKDSCYPRLKQAQVVRECLLNMLDDRDREIQRLGKKLSKARASCEKVVRKIEEKKVQVKRLSKGWDIFTNAVCVPAECIHQLVQDNELAGEANLKPDFTSVLTEIGKAASDLQRLTVRAFEEIQIVGTYPYDSESDSSEEGQSKIERAEISKLGGALEASTPN